MGFLGCLLVLLSVVWITRQKSLVISTGKSIVLLLVISAGIVMSIAGQ